MQKEMTQDASAISEWEWTGDQRAWKGDRLNRGGGSALRAAWRKYLFGSLLLFHALQRWHRRGLLEEDFFLGEKTVSQEAKNQIALRTTAWTHAEAHLSSPRPRDFSGNRGQGGDTPTVERSTPPPVNRWTQEPPRTLLMGSPGELGWAVDSQPCPRDLPHIHPFGQLSPCRGADSKC